MTSEITNSSAQGENTKHSLLKPRSRPFTEQRITGYRGTKIVTHRAMLRLDFPMSRWVDVLVIPILITICLYLAWPLISQFWYQVIDYWSVRLDRNILTRVDKGLIPGFSTIPYPYVYARLPTSIQWLSGMLITLALLFGPTLLPNRMLPLAYAIRAVGFIQASAQFYFYLWASHFHYDARTSIAALMQTSLLITILTPWIYALIYNIFDFTFTRKLFLSTFAVTYLIVLVPLQYILIGVLLLHFSLLWYPLIYILGSTFIQIGTLIALYAWAMSWR